MGTLNILVVDDSSTMRAMIRKTIQISGLTEARFFESGNGQEGLDVLEKVWIDLILADLNMPVMGGLEMIERVRAKPDWMDIPVIVVSTESSEIRIAEIGARGIHFVHKPFRPEQIREIIQRLLGGPLHACD